MCQRVVAVTVREGVQAQMQAFLAGFSAVMSPSKIALFAAAEASTHALKLV
jgi:hypothetical protein